MDAETPQERDRRNRFCKRFDFRIEFKPGTEEKEGWIYADRLKDLNPSWASERSPIREITPGEIFLARVRWETEAIKAKDAVASLQQFTRDNEKEVRRLRRRQRWCWLLLAVGASLLWVTSTAPDGLFT